MRETRCHPVVTSNTTAEMDTPARRLRSSRHNLSPSPAISSPRASSFRAGPSNAAASSSSSSRAAAPHTPSRYALRNGGGADVFGDITVPVRNGSPRGKSPVGLGEKTPGKGKAASRDYGDRFIPTRDGTDQAAAFSMALHFDATPYSETSPFKRPNRLGQSTDAAARREETNATFTQLLRTELMPASPTSAPRPHSPSTRSPARHARDPATRRNMPLSFDQSPRRSASSAQLAELSAGSTPRHHHPPPEHPGSAERDGVERELSPASTLPPIPLHAPATPVSGHSRAPGGGPSGSTHRAHQSLVSLTSHAFPNPGNTSPTSSEERNTGRKSAFSPPASGGRDSPSTPTKRRLLNYNSPTAVRMASFSGSNANGSLDDMGHEAYRLSPVGKDSQTVLLSPRKHLRNIPRTPFKVLDAPELADDFYLNLVSWSSTNVLAVGLATCIYLWSAQTSKVTKLCDLVRPTSTHHPTPDSITGVEWTNRGSTLALGSNRGLVEIWDAEYCKRIRTMSGHTGRVGCVAWNGPILTSGSRDKTILHRDTRAPDQYIRKLEGYHKQEVCGLKWNADTEQLASGGNDNKLFVWSAMDSRPTWRFAEHRAAVKAIAWNPHQRGVLASGGGTADKTIRFWNSVTGALISDWDTGSQVCNLMWSRNSNELVSTHGYSGGPVSNQIHIWRYPSMTQIATLTGHTTRVLYLAMSPDGQTIVTGAGDETLRFWNAFERGRGEILQSVMNGGGSGMGSGGGFQNVPALNPFARIR